MSLTPFFLRLGGAVCCVCLLLFAVGGCGGSAESTGEVLRKQIGAYAAKPSREMEQKIEGNFGKLDEEISVLQGGGQAGKAADAKRLRDELRVQYTAAKMAAGVNSLKNTIQGIGDLFKQAGDEIGEMVRTNSAGQNP